jgi:octopine/nopaline transport system ATP-binding protein
MDDRTGTAENEVVVKVVDLHKYFGKLEVLKGVSFEVRQSGVLSIIGASGSGKSTLLRCINNLERPTSGEVYITGQPIGFRVDQNGVRRPASQRSTNKLRMEIGMVFQSFNLWPHLTAVENIMEAPLRVRKLTAPEARDIAMYFLEKVDLLDKQDEYPARLSGGQQQRVAIARALAMRPKVMMFDEPTSSLDPELMGEVLDVMENLAKDGMTMVVVTHEIGFARVASDRIMFLHDGIIEEEGTPEEILTNPKSERCRQFLSKILH